MSNTKPMSNAIKSKKIAIEPSLDIYSSKALYIKEIKKCMECEEKEFEALTECYWILCLQYLFPNNQHLKKCTAKLPMITLEKMSDVRGKQSTMGVKRDGRYEQTDNHFNDYLDDGGKFASITKKLLNICENADRLQSKIDSFEHIHYSSGRSIISGYLPMKEVKHRLIFKFEKVSLAFHEFLIGKYVINQLRSLVPTFIWTFCLKPITGMPFFVNGYPNFDLCDVVSFDKLSVSDYKNDTQCLIVLEDADGDNLASQVDTIDLKELCLVLINIFKSLHLAYDKFKFTHWDLHTENVILRKLDTPSCYLDPISNKYLHVNKFLPIIFDYGLSTANNPNPKNNSYYTSKLFGDKKIRLDSFKCFECYKSGLNPFWGSFSTDILRLLNSVICDSSGSRKDINMFLNHFMITYFFQTFNEKKYKMMISEMNNNYTFCPPSEFNAHHSFDDFISSFVTHVRNRFPDFVYESDEPVGELITSETYPKSKSDDHLSYLNNVDDLSLKLVDSPDFMFEYLIHNYVLNKYKGNYDNLKETLQPDYNYKEVLEETKKKIASLKKTNKVKRILPEFIKKNYFLQPKMNSDSSAYKPFTTLF